MREQRVIHWRDKRASIEADAWVEVAEGDAWPAAALVLIPLSDALARRDELVAHAAPGLMLSPSDDPAAAVPLFDHIDVIAVQFPKFTDGRGYSTATLLRERYGWRGELRATGDVLRDQLLPLARVGFDSFALRRDRDPEAALSAFADFSDAYQRAAAWPELPFYRRRTSAAAS